MSSKTENKFLINSRERERWRRKLAAPADKEPKSGSVYFRPSVSDNRKIEDLAQLTGETKNAIVEKLVACALHNKTLTTKKLEEQTKTFRRLEDKIDHLADDNRQTSLALEELRREQQSGISFSSRLLGEIYCMVHTAVSLLRVALLQILNFTNKQPVSESVLTAFDETSDLSVQRSLSDLRSTLLFHRIKNQAVADENIYWKSKLRNAQSSDETPTEQAGQTINQAQ